MTESGLLMIPMTIGIMITSIGSGVIIAKRGRYKIFPIVGTIVTTASIVWMTQLTATTSLAIFGAMIFCFGFGLGLVMQVIILAVQNAVDPHEIGTATSANNFFREVGASVGIALFGSLFTTRLTDQLAEFPVAAQSFLATAPADEAAQAGSVLTQLSDQGLSPQLVQELPGALSAFVGTAYTEALAPAFWYLVPIAAIAIVLACFLKEIPLSTEAGMVARGEAIVEGSATTPDERGTGSGSEDTVSGADGAVTTAPDDPEREPVALPVG